MQHNSVVTGLMVVKYIVCNTIVYAEYSYRFNGSKIYCMQLELLNLSVHGGLMILGQRSDS